VQLFSNEYYCRNKASLDNNIVHKDLDYRKDCVETKRIMDTLKVKNPTEPSSSSPKITSTTTRKRTRTRTDSCGVRSSKSAAWELAGAGSVYLFCVSLPTIMGIIIRLYQNSFLSSGNETKNRTWTSFSPSRMTDHTRDSSHQENMHLIALPYNIFKVLQRWAMAYLQTNALSDVQFFVIVSVALALFRVFLIHILVPKYLVPTKVEAIVRCKSTHILSSAEYHFDTITNFNNGGIVASPKRFSNKQMPQMVEGVPLVPCLDDEIPHQPPMLRKRIIVKDYLKRVWTKISNTLTLTLGMTNTPSNSIDAAQAIRIRSAPRYATAIFRFSCCAISCTWAILNFHSANFWPVWVGGIATAQTKNCWDLSGSIAALHGTAFLDSDFDDQNSSLRYFFLGQASYQMHSLCFHGLSMVLLALYGGEKGIFVSVRSSLKSYFAPIVEHLLSITLVMSSFIFSGSRRLGAIAIFALEVSSLFLQLLQICINAPEGSRLRRPRTIKIVHRFMTIPVFMYCRLFVVPFIVLYSAAFESKDWIRQIERAMAPGCGSLIYYFFNALLVVVVGLNLVFLRRLLFHPHVRQILS